MAVMALAMESGYVYLQSGRSSWLWQVHKSKFCSSHNMTTMECFYEPRSSCSLNDALGPAANEPMEVIANKYPAVHDSNFKVLPNGSLALPSPIANSARVVILHHTGGGSATRFVPSVMKSILDCSPVADELGYYWWRAVSTAYFLRPNQRTLQYLEQFRTIELDPSDGEK